MSEPYFPPPPESAEEEEQEGHERGSRRAKINALLHEGWEKGKEKGLEGLLKGRLSVEHKLGFGAVPNVIPSGEPITTGELRTVEIGWHPVPGMGAVANSALGKMVTKEVGRYPDPTQHWAVLVGDYVHQLWMDESLDIIYINGVLNRADWHVFEVGKTRFNDQAMKQAADMTIHNMRGRKSAYNLISNNCQNFATVLLDAIQIGKHQEFATTFAVYQAATGAGTIKDLFADPHPDEQTVDGDPSGMHRVNTVQVAQHVMDENTTKVDNHRSFFHRSSPDE